MMITNSSISSLNLSINFLGFPFRTLFMSLLLNQPSQLCFRKPVFVRSLPRISNGVPESFHYVLIKADPCGEDRGKVLTWRTSGGPMPTLKSTIEKDENDTKLHNDLKKELGTIGSSNGWLPTLKDGVLGLRDINLNAYTDPKRISLPPLVTLPHCQTQYVTNVAMSTSSPEEEDCVVAVKFLGPQLSLCRPAQSNSEWINIRIQNPSFFSSTVMFSKKNDEFRIVGSGGHLIGSWDLHKHSKNPKLQSLRFQNHPNLTKTHRDLLDSCCTSQHLVESRTTGETFLVKWYKKTTGKILDGIARMRTEAVMAFKLDEEGNAVYTQDMEDQGIFLTDFEALCDQFSYFLAWNQPNRVYLLDVDETILVELADQKWNRSRRPSPTWRYYTSWKFD